MVWLILFKWFYKTYRYLWIGITVKLTLKQIFETFFIPLVHYFFCELLIFCFEELPFSLLVNYTFHFFWIDGEHWLVQFLCHSFTHSFLFSCSTVPFNLAVHGFWHCPNLTLSIIPFNCTCSVIHFHSFSNSDKRVDWLSCLFSFTLWKKKLSLWQLI